MFIYTHDICKFSVYSLLKQALVNKMKLIPSLIVCCECMQSSDKWVDYTLVEKLPQKRFSVRCDLQEMFHLIQSLESDPYFSEWLNQG